MFPAAAASQTFVSHTDYASLSPECQKDLTHLQEVKDKIASGLTFKEALSVLQDQIEVSSKIRDKELVNLTRINFLIETCETSLKQAQGIEKTTESLEPEQERSVSQISFLLATILNSKLQTLQSDKKEIMDTLIGCEAHIDNLEKLALTVKAEEESRQKSSDLVLESAEPAAAASDEKA